jgi:hypothetical protein
MNIFTKVALAALVSFGAMGASAPANAGVDVDIRVHTPRVVVRKPVVVVRPAYRPRVVVVRPAPVVVVRPAPVVVVRPSVGRCAPGLALEKAANRGLNRVAIEKIGPNRVVVSGRTGGVWAKMVFANVRGCPRL